MDIQFYLLTLFLNLNYTKMRDGCCRGSSLRWLEACFLDDEELCDARVNRIVTEGNSLPQAINDAKAKKGINLTTRDKEALDILAFYDSIELYQHHYTHKPLFNTT
ncbi:MAG: hypothetical protein ACRCXC_00455 [Legionella sp.]